MRHTPPVVALGFYMLVLLQNRFWLFLMNVPILTVDIEIMLNEILVSYYKSNYMRY